MPQFIDHFGEINDFMRGFVVAVILIPSAVTGILAGSVSDLISRKYTIALGSLIFAVGSALGTILPQPWFYTSPDRSFAACGAPNLATLIFARCIAGSGEGFFLSAATVYLYGMFHPLRALNKLTVIYAGAKYVPSIYEVV